MAGALTNLATALYILASALTLLTLALTILVSALTILALALTLLASALILLPSAFNYNKKYNSCMRGKQTKKEAERGHVLKHGSGRVCTLHSQLLLGLGGGEQRQNGRDGVQ